MTDQISTSPRPGCTQTQGRDLARRRARAVMVPRGLADDDACPQPLHRFTKIA